MNWPYFVALAALLCSLYCVYVVRDVRRKLNEATTFMVNRDKQVTELAAACNRDVGRLEARLLDISQNFSRPRSRWAPSADSINLDLNGATQAYIPGRTTINLELTSSIRDVTPEGIQQFMSRGPMTHVSKPAELPKPPEPPTPPTWHERITDDEKDPV